MRRRLRPACVLFVLALSACGAGPPPALDGLWSPSLKACEAGLGVTFKSNAVSARFGGEAMVLLAEPRYAARTAKDATLVRIEYKLPDAPGGVSAAPGRGVIELERSATGRLRSVGRQFVDLQTGSARVALQPGALDRMFDLGLCPKKKSGR